MESIHQNHYILKGKTSQVSATKYRMSNLLKFNKQIKSTVLEFDHCSKTHISRISPDIHLVFSFLMAPQHYIVHSSDTHLCHLKCEYLMSIS